MTDNTKLMADLETALAAAQTEIQNAPYDSTNPHFSSRFASLAAVHDAVVPTLAKHGIAVTQTVHLEPFRLVTSLRKGGVSIDSEWPLAVAKSQDMGAQTTYARRYTLLGLVGIAGEADDDGESAKTAPAKPGGSVRAAVKGDQKITELKSNVKAFAEQLHEVATGEDLEDLLTTFHQTIENAKVDLPSWWETGEGMPDEFVPLADRITAVQERLAIQGVG